MCISFTGNLPAVIILDFLVMGWSVHNRRLSEFLERLMLFSRIQEERILTDTIGNETVIKFILSLKNFPFL